MPPLRRELPLGYNKNGRMGHIAALILDEVRDPDVRPLHIPMLRDERLKTACAALLREPGRPETLEERSGIAGASSCTLARLFARETGMRFVDWRHQARLAEVPVRLYARLSALTAMFRKALGKAPRDYFGHPAEGLRAPEER